MKKAFVGAILMLLASAFFASGQTVRIERAKAEGKTFGGVSDTRLDVEIDFSAQQARFTVEFEPRGELVESIGQPATIKEMTQTVYMRSPYTVEQASFVLPSEAILKSITIEAMFGMRPQAITLVPTNGFATSANDANITVATITPGEDIDEDGWAATGTTDITGWAVVWDCDDTNPEIHPGSVLASKRPVDCNCDGKVELETAMAIHPVVSLLDSICELRRPGVPGWWKVPEPGQMGLFFTGKLLRCNETEGPVPELVKKRPKYR